MKGRYSRLRYIQTLDPERDCEQIANLVTLYEFPFEYRFGFAFGILTDCTFPSVSGEFSRTGQIRDHGQKRYDDGMLFEYEMKHHGLDSPHGRATIRKLNRIHSHYPISNDDYLATLASHTLTPIRWINTYGWRPLSDHETRALVAVNQRMGHLMGIKNMPHDLQGLSDVLTTALRERARYHPTNRDVAHQIIRVVQGWWPRALRRYVPVVVAALIDPEIRALLGLPEPPPAFTAAVRNTLILRGKCIRFAPPRRDHRPYQPKPRSYPTGWTLDHLGPVSSAGKDGAVSP
ncbi:oxygenase MpaB family protein [Streptomyces olivoreticuli]|uniref:oxygenase MpaB family protein n=1 Tax=Streptomyces olivoreticuli TaxID=68246 RepID=UPI00265905DB|nr:oxygenase MpaB family protein [Streptomyces olivoreticuli]WKK23951.1 oxygenase MpaB family protein [Streptomyces olivoreticuli]